VRDGTNIVNVQVPTTGTYLIDNLRFLPVASDRCTGTPNGTSCTHNNACTTGETCQSGVCTSGSTISCDDANPCTDDTCNPSSGCVHSYNTSPCEDGNACTTADTCFFGSCLGGPPLSCDDNNPCTNDGCDPRNGCTRVNNTASCSDGNPCTEKDICVNGTCSPGAPCGSGYTCDSGSGCLDIDECATGLAKCDPGVPCTNTPGSFACGCLINGVQCNAGEFCDQGLGFCDHSTSEVTCQRLFGYAPVCADDGQTYDNACLAALAGKSVAYPVPCF
jgi:Dictyostelium (slime mold) repeat